MDNKDLNYEEVIKKIEEMKKGRSFDLSTDEDLSIALMNLISIEEHLFFTAEKLKKPEYFDLLSEVRAVRTRLMKKMIPQTEGESWCISKHLLATSMRLIEVGNKLQSSGNKVDAKEAYESAYEMYSIFFALRFKIMEVCDVKDMAKKGDNPWTLKDIVDKLVNCCDE